MKVKHKRLHYLEGEIIAVFPTIDAQFQVDWGKGMVSCEFEESLIFIPYAQCLMPND